MRARVKKSRRHAIWRRSTACLDVLPEDDPVADVEAGEERGEEEARDPVDVEGTDLGALGLVGSRWRSCALGLLRAAGQQHRVLLQCQAAKDHYLRETISSTPPPIRIRVYPTTRGVSKYQVILPCFLLNFQRQPKRNSKNTKP